MEYMEIISVPIIATIVYWIMSMLKTITKNNETFKRFIPLLSGGIGAVLGVVLYYALPDTIAASNVMVAIMSGAASGMTATGCNQVIKQLLSQNKSVAASPDDKKEEGQLAEENKDELSQKKDDNDNIDEQQK